MDDGKVGSQNKYNVDRSHISTFMIFSPGFCSTREEIQLLMEHWYPDYCLVEKETLKGLYDSSGCYFILKKDLIKKSKFLLVFLHHFIIYIVCMDTLVIF